MAGHRPKPKVMALEPMAAKWEAFGWHAQEIDGHDLSAIGQALVDARAETSKPSVIVAHTIKGKGVSFMETTIWHYRTPNESEVTAALASQRCSCEKCICPSEEPPRSETMYACSGDIGNRMFDRHKGSANTLPQLRHSRSEHDEYGRWHGTSGQGLWYTQQTPFTTTRRLEQIRIGAAYHEAPVVIVGTGSGLSYAELGATHHSLEDLAILRSIPNLQVCTS